MNSKLPRWIRGGSPTPPIVSEYLKRQKGEKRPSILSFILSSIFGITIAVGEYYLYKAYKQKVANSDPVGKERQYSLGEKVAWIGDKGLFVTEEILYSITAVSDQGS
mgnify:CR=1 FL=1